MLGGVPWDTLVELNPLSSLLGSYSMAWEFWGVSCPSDSL